MRSLSLAVGLLAVLLICNCASSLRPGRLIGIAVDTYDAAIGATVLTGGLPSVIGPDGLDAWGRHAGYDWILGKPTTGELWYELPIRDPKADQTRLQGLVFGGPAWPNLNAEHPCTLDRKLWGDLVVNANGSSVCVLPAFTFDIIDSRGTVLFTRLGSDPAPPPAFGEGLPAGTVVVPAVGQDRLFLRLHIEGSMVFRVGVLRAPITATRYFYAP